jgi:hypothetical protein
MAMVQVIHASGCQPGARAGVRGQQHGRAADERQRPWRVAVPVVGGGDSREATG